VAVAVGLMAVGWSAPARGVDDTDNPTQPRGLAGPSGAVNTTPFGTDAVSTANGAVSIVIPIGPRYTVSDHLGYQLSLGYTSSVWTYSVQEIYSIACPSGGGSCTTNTSVYATASVHPDFNAGAGWYLGLGNLYAPNTSKNPTDAWVYVAPGGSRHKFFAEVHRDAPTDGSSNHFYTRDGTYLRLRKANSGLPSRIEFPDGTRHEFDGSGRVTTMKDRWGNAVTVTYSSDGKLWTIADGVRTQKIHFVNYGSQYGNNVIDRVELTAFDGTPAVYTFAYRGKSIRRTCYDTDPANNLSDGEEGWVPTLFLKEIVGPEGAVWSFMNGTSLMYFDGEKRNHAQCSYSGIVQRMTYPTKGVVNWSYQTWKFPTTGFPWVDKAPGVSTKTLSTPIAAEPTGTWTFDPDLKSSIGEVWTDVIDPAGHRTRHFSFIPLPSDPGKISTDYGLPISKASGNVSDDLFLTQEVRSSSGALVRRQFVKFAKDSISSSWVGVDRILTNRRVVKSRTVLVDDGSRTIDVELGDYDGLGHYREATTTDSWGSAPARTTRTEWNPASGCYSSCPSGAAAFATPPTGEPWLLERFGFTRQVENGVVARQEATFDATTGALVETRARRDFGYGGADPAPSDHDVVTRLCRDASGHLASVRLYGGDTQALNGASIGCAANDSSVYRTDYESQYGVPRRAFLAAADGTSIGFDLFSATIDSNTGLASEICDANGLCQRFTYDDLGRLTRAEDSPSVPAALRGATVRFGYDDYPGAEGGWARWEGFECPVGGTAPCDAAALPESLTQFGGFGRPYLRWRKNADGSWSRQVSERDARGNLVRQTTWIPESMSTAAAPATIFGGHDVYGRPTTITLPDGKVQTQSFTGFRVRHRFAPVATALDGAETIFRTTEHYDRNGRLVRLEEPAMAGGGYASADYTYDLLGGLFRIVHTAGSTVQQRTWVRDGRGFLVSESIPERVDAVTLGSYDAAGNATSRTVGGETLEFSFDRAGRPLTVARPLAGGGSELLQRFTYDTGVGYGLGRLASAESWTRFTAAALAEAKVQESFEYSGLRGNVSTKTTTTYLDSVAAASTNQSYSWAALGGIHELGYPTGISGDEPARIVPHQYTNGFLTAIPGYATGLTYHDNFALASVQHANGVTDWMGQDPNRLGRPSALWTSGVANAEDWNSGAYLYDGSGNIRAIGGQRYRYDGVSRLMEAELRIPETSATLFGVESFTYDAYGNLTSRETTEGGSTTVTNTPADAATNRLTGATSYDSEGNLTSWNGAQYGFDALGRMIRMQNGAEDWLFVYSSGGERVLQVDGGGAGAKRWTVRDVAGRVLREWIEPQGGSPAWDRDWIYRGANLLATVDATTTRHLTLDHLGTPRLVTDQSGAKLAFKSYWPYGREATDPNQDALSKKFTGHERDAYDPSSTADDLDYMHARFANPATGRFLSVDPLAGGIGRPQSLNRFAYVGGNPVSAVDPTGLCSVLVWNGDPASGDLQGALCDGAVDAAVGGGGGIRGVGGGNVANDPLRKTPIGFDGVVPENWIPKEPPAEEPPDVPTWDPKTNERIKQLHRCLQDQAREFVNRVESELGLQLRISDGYRSFAQQDALYRQGRTAPGPVVTSVQGGESYHNFGLAFDIVPMNGGQPDYGVDWEPIGTLGESLGLEWGGRWTSPRDRPHFQNDLGYSTTELGRMSINLLHALPCGARP